VVHEVYIKLLGHGATTLQDRSHFLTLAARAMRQVMVDHARARLTQKRGGGAKHELLDESRIEIDADASTILDLDSALDRLQELDPRLGKVVSLRFFGGLSSDETAAILGVTDRTVRRDWRKARAFLYGELGGDQES
jgi:RNA polymerase sigma factor (TIGR02999 family)